MQSLFSVTKPSTQNSQRFGLVEKSSVAQTGDKFLPQMSISSQAAPVRLQKQQGPYFKMSQSSQSNVNRYASIPSGSAQSNIQGQSSFLGSSGQQTFKVQSQGLDKNQMKMSVGRKPSLIQSGIKGGQIMTPYEAMQKDVKYQKGFDMDALIIDDYIKDTNHIREKIIQNKGVPSQTVGDYCEQTDRYTLNRQALYTPMMDEFQMRFRKLLFKAGFATIGVSLLSYITMSIVSRKSMLVKGLMNAKAAVAAGFASFKAGTLGVVAAKPEASIIIGLTTFVILKHGGPSFRHLHRVLFHRRGGGSNQFYHSGDEQSVSDQVQKVLNGLDNYDNEMYRHLYADRHAKKQGIANR